MLWLEKECLLYWSEIEVNIFNYRSMYLHDKDSNALLSLQWKRRHRIEMLTIWESLCFEWIVF